MKTAYCLGPNGSYSAIIAKKMYPKLQMKLCNSFFEVVKAMSGDNNSIALLPVENSITSDVHENIDYLFSQNNVQIMAEGYLVIDLNLIGLHGSKIEDITSVYSHPKALLQTSLFINEHNLATIETNSTSEGKNTILDENNIHKACIGSSELTDESKLVILAKNIGNYQNNMTRFLAITHLSEVDKLHDEPIIKGSYVFNVKHEPGTLARVLTQLAATKVNLTKIESRPIPGTEWEYSFLVDLEMNSNLVSEVEKILEKNTAHIKRRGLYVKGNVYIN